MSSRPLESIIITNYNHARFLGQSVESALFQSYPNVQVIVVDHGSTDGSKEVLSSYGSRLTAVIEENGGMPLAVTAGFPLAKGEIVCLLDADDPLLRHAMDKDRAFVPRG